MRKAARQFVMIPATPGVNPAFSLKAPRDPLRLFPALAANHEHCKTKRKTRLLSGPGRLASPIRTPAKGPRRADLLGERVRSRPSDVDSIGGGKGCLGPGGTLRGSGTCPAEGDSSESVGDHTSKEARVNSFKVSQCPEM